MKTKYKILLILIIVVVFILLLWFKFCRQEWNHKNGINGNGDRDNWTITTISNQIKEYNDIERYLDSNINIYDKIDIPVYYINLDSSKDRRENSESELKHYKVPLYTRVEGIPGNTLPSLESGSYKDNYYINNYKNLTGSELGCTLSHIVAIKTAYMDKRDVALILEDDFSFSLVPYWDTKLSDLISRAPKDWEIIQIFTMHGKIGGKQEFMFHDKNNPAYSNLSYIINRRGMHKLLNKTTHPDGTIILGKTNESKEGTSDRYIPSLLKTYYTTRPLVIPGILKSTIHTDHEKSHHKRTREVIDLYKKYNSSFFKIPPKQLQFSKALHDMANFLEKIGVPYRLSCGTMLGAYRQNQFISYDGDIDIEVLYEDYKPDIEKGNDTVKLQKIRGKLDMGYELTFKHYETGVNIDIFLLYDERDYRWFGSYNGRCNFAKNKMCRNKIPKTDIETILFMGRNFPISKKPIEYLVSNYGLNWNIPKSYNYADSLKLHNYGIIEEDFPPRHRLDPPRDTKKYNLWPRKISEMNKPIIWLYWQNKNNDTVKPPYLDLCLETVKKHCGGLFEIIVLDDDMVRVVSTNIHSNFTNIEPLAMRADYVRFCLIEEYGGIWLDCDIVVQGDLSFMIRDLDTYNFVAFEHKDENDISIGIMSGNKHNRYAQYMKLLFEEHQSYSKWKNKKHKINWAQPTETAKSFLNDLRSFYHQEVKTYPASMVYPIHFTKSKNYYWSRGELDPLIGKLPAVYLHNQMYDDKHKRLSSDDVLNGDYRISKLFRGALS